MATQINGRLQEILNMAAALREGRRNGIRSRSDLHTPRGQWVEPRAPSTPLRPGSELPDWKYAAPKIGQNKDKSWVDKKGYVHSTYKPPTTAQINAYLKKYSDYLEAQRQYDSKTGPQWDSYNRRMDKYATAYNNWEQRQEQRAERQRVATANAQMKQADRMEHARRKAELERVFHGRISPEAYAGLSPWNPMYGEFKKLTKKQMKDLGIDYGRVKSPNKKIIHLADGTTAEVIDSELGVPLGFSQTSGYKGASETVTGPDGITSADYAAKAFDGKHKTHKWDGDDCGHIIGLEYSAYYQLLKVKFKTDNSVVIYYRVPSTVAAELLHFAETKQQSTNTFDGSQRHVLGIRFWDLIRIRGTKNGSRYRFEYMEKGEHTYSFQGRPRTHATEVASAARENEGYDTSKLKDMLEQYRAAHGGKNPPPELYREMIDKLSGGNQGARKTSAGDLSGMTRYKIPQYEGLTEDNLNKYFDKWYNDDLANRNINRGRLQAAYDLYKSENYDTPADVVKLLQAAGVDLGTRR